MPGPEKETIKKGPCNCKRQDWKPY